MNSSHLYVVSMSSENQIKITLLPIFNKTTWSFTVLPVTPESPYVGYTRIRGMLALAKMGGMGVI